jgi:DNA (cytosine-5)-methyltransferase 1
MSGMDLSVVDLFAGAGGISEGFRTAGYSVLAGADIDPDAATTYRLNFPEAECVRGDLRQPEVRERVVDAARGATVLAGGPPCQAYSQVRNHARLIDDPRNALYREFVSVLGEVSPHAFVVENVPGMDQMGVRSQVAADLSLDGEYDVLPQVVNAADFGVPQTRKRLVFLGVRRSLGRAPLVEGTGAASAVGIARRTTRSVRYEVAATTPLGEDLAAAVADPNDLRAVTARQAISDLESLKTGNRRDAIPYERLDEPTSAYQRLMRDGAGDLAENVQVPRMNEDTRLRLRRIPPGGNHLDIPDELRERYLSGQRWGPDSGTGRLARRHYYAYRRLHPDIWAWTLNTKADAVYHYRYPRALSVREFARLHSFPDRFTFATDERKGELPGRIAGGPAHSRYRQVGNAVPPLLATAIGDALAKATRQAGEG